LWSLHPSGWQPESDPLPTKPCARARPARAARRSTQPAGCTGSCAALSFAPQRNVTQGCWWCERTPPQTPRACPATCPVGQARLGRAGPAGRSAGSGCSRTPGKQPRAGPILAHPPALPTTAPHFRHPALPHLPFASARGVGRGEALVPGGKGQVLGLEAVVDGGGEGDNVRVKVAVGGRGRDGHDGEGGIRREEELRLRVPKLA
jgi:hypothetical protein